MSASVINGKLFINGRSKRKVPSPAEIAALAWDRAEKVALAALDALPIERLKVGTALHESKTAELAALRAEVITLSTTRGKQ